jgi:hypothetical protein
MCRSEKALSVSPTKNKHLALWTYGCGFYLSRLIHIENSLIAFKSSFVQAYPNPLKKKYFGILS